MDITIASIVINRCIKERLVTLCTDDSNLTKVPELRVQLDGFGEDDSIQDYRACLIAAIGSDCKCGTALDRGRTASYGTCSSGGIRAPLIFSTLTRDLGTSRNQMWQATRMLIESTCINVSKLLVQRIVECEDRAHIARSASALTRRESNQFNRHHIEAIFSVVQDVEWHYILERALDLGMVDRVVTHCEHSLDCLRKLLIRSMCKSKSIHLPLKKLMMRINDGTISLTPIFDPDFNPWNFADLLTMVSDPSRPHRIEEYYINYIDRDDPRCRPIDTSATALSDLPSAYLQICSDAMVRELLDGKQSEESIHFVTECAFVVELATNLGRSKMVRELQNVLQHLYTSAHPFPPSHWLNGFESKKVSALGTLNRCLPKDLVNLVLSYLVDDCIC